MTPKKKKKKIFDALDAIFDFTQKKMTPKDAQITLKAPIFFFSFHKFGFRETKIPKKPKKKKILETLNFDIFDGCKYRIEYCNFI